MKRAWFIALVLAGCHHESPEAETDAGAPVVQVEPAKRADIDELADASGLLQALPGRDAKLGALVAGTLSQVLVAEGDHVAKGQLLARVDPTAVHDQVSQAEAVLAQAQGQQIAAAARLARAEAAFKAGVAAGQEVDDARAQDSAAKSGMKAAQASLSTAKNQVERSEVRAPFEGTVAHVFMAGGEPLDGSGKPVVEIADTRKLELHAHVAPAVAVRLHPGDVAQVFVEGAAADARAGAVVAVAPTVGDAGTVVVRVGVDNPDGALKAGAAARARIRLASLHQVLTVPSSAVVPMSQEQSGTAAHALAVEVVQPNGTVVRRAVTLGAGSGTRVQVVDGLKEGEQVVVSGAYALPDGTRVTTAPAAGDSGS